MEQFPSFFSSFVPILLGAVANFDTSLFSSVFLPYMGFLHMVYIFLVLCHSLQPDSPAPQAVRL